VSVLTSANGITHECRLDVMRENVEHENGITIVIFICFATFPSTAATIKSWSSAMTLLKNMVMIFSRLKNEQAENKMGKNVNGYRSNKGNELIDKTITSC
jgi:hypothetical protein